MSIPASEWNMYDFTPFKSDIDHWETTNNKDFYRFIIEFIYCLWFNKKL